MRYRKIAKNRLLASSRLSVHPSAWNNSVSTGWILIKSDIRLFFENLPNKFRDSLKWVKNNGYCMWRPTDIYHISHLTQLFLEWGMFHTILHRKQNTHFIFNNVFFENRALYAIICKNFVEPGRPQITTWRMRIARWISTTKIQAQNVKYLLIFHFNSGRTHAPQCYVLCALPDLYISSGHWTELNL